MTGRMKIGNVLLKYEVHRLLFVSNPFFGNLITALDKLSIGNPIGLTTWF